MTLWNSLLFFRTYVPEAYLLTPLKAPSIKKTRNILDRWVISKLNKLILEVTLFLEEYDITSATRSIENFVINDLSLWYIRRSRKRFQGPEAEKELKEAFQTLRFVLSVLSKLTAPFIPFLSEEIYQEIKGLKYKKEKSIHLEKWPKANKKLINEKLNKKMEEVREIVTLALAKRAQSKIKVRQPLNELTITNYHLKKEKELLNLIKEELNVKKISFGKKLKLDTKITPQLKEEGVLREVIRNIQQMRKTAGFTPKDKILVQFKAPSQLRELLLNNKKSIIQETKAKDLVFGEKKSGFKVKKEVSVDKEKLHLFIKK